MEKRTAFEKDSNSPLAELFLEVRDYIKICIGNEVKERFTQNLTSFHIKEGGFCYIKAYDGYIHIGWFKGKFIDDKFDFLFGDGKTIRGQRITKFDKKIRESIKYYVNETLIYLIEYDELKKIKKGIS